MIMAKKKENVVRRSLYYYDLSWKYFDEKSGEYVSVKRKEEKFENFLKKFYFKEKKVNVKFISMTENEDNLFIITDKIENDKICFRIVLCKTNALPLIEQDGELEELEKYINKKQNIAEITHCVFFKDTNIVGSEFNFSGARISALNWYIPKILNICGDNQKLYQIKFMPKIDNDSYKKLAKNETITLFDMTFKPDSEAYKNVLAHNSLFSGAVKNVPDAEIIEITLKRRKNKTNSYTGMNDVLSSDDLEELLTEYRDDIGRLYISQGSYCDAIDLLSDKLVSKVDIVRTKKRTIDSKDVYKKIEEFYKEEVKP